uniref:Uncharacterized protein n=1 Tax=Zea mays TaxID=4577 RepID=A0A804PW14_MAIZE
MSKGLTWIIPERKQTLRSRRKHAIPGILQLGKHKDISKAEKDIVLSSTSIVMLGIFVLHTPFAKAINGAALHLFSFAEAINIGRPPRNSLRS